MTVNYRSVLIMNINVKIQKKKILLNVTLCLKSVLAKGTLFHEFKVVNIKLEFTTINTRETILKIRAPTIKYNINKL